MVKALQNLGDRLIGRVVPEIVAEAGVQYVTVNCGCFWDSPGYVRKVKYCNAVCGSCQVIGPC
jgi:hypothetical protein